MSKFCAHYGVIPYCPYAELRISRWALPPLSWNGKKQLHYTLSDVTLDDIVIQIWRGVIFLFLGRLQCSVSIHTTHNHFTAFFPGPPRWACARRELLDFMVQGKINRGRHRPSGWVPLHLYQPVPTSTIPHFFTGQRTIAFGLGRRC